MWSPLSPDLSPSQPPLEPALGVPCLSRHEGVCVHFWTADSRSPGTLTVSKSLWSKPGKHPGSHKPQVQLLGGRPDYLPAQEGLTLTCPGGLRLTSHWVRGKEKACFEKSERCTQLSSLSLQKFASSCFRVYVKVTLGNDQLFPVSMGAARGKNFT